MHYQNQTLPAYQTSNMKNLCDRYKDYYVMGQLSNGTQFEGIIQAVDNDNVTILIPENVEEGETDRQFGYGYYPRRYYRRFRPYRYPLGLLSGLLLYPFLFPPYYPPYY
ncbi:MULTISPECIES: hypothetical protein [Gracilibacillus]|uniref:Uncharacterized protein n=1 Tax=Gracilibacillus dipsosauri TaxID=178340 RepID=A0A317KWS0_9BACI|nr:hypothetical protein [Gracilibacillus dipsosauri]PWU66928.1 hypothetical protein DLJ74_18885 [Gracilibacillus dipsosauri]